jgi:hypothetical protein
LEKPLLLNPDGRLHPAIVSGLRDARKTKSLWAKRLERASQIETIEGVVRAEVGDYLCRGIECEVWPQKEKSLLERYFASSHFDEKGWQRFDPKPDLQPVQAVAMDHPFRVLARWGELTGKANDYLVQSKTDPDDIWIVDKAIFEASYEYLVVDNAPVLQKSEIKENVAIEHQVNDTAFPSELNGESRSQSGDLGTVACESRCIEEKGGSQ